MSIRNIGLAAAALTIGAACSDSTAPADNGCKDGTTSVEATVTTGSSIAFSWAPACEVALVLVEDENGGDQWLASTALFEGSPKPSEANRIKPPVAYGVAPAGIAGLETTAPEQLVAGRSYILVLWRLMPANGATSCPLHLGDYCMIGSKSFTR